MFAYVDETGNTGSNIFDEQQPNFYTAALVSRSNFDLLYAARVNALSRDLGVDSIHASLLGARGIEASAREIGKILKASEARFFVSRVEKSYLVATKVFDVFFDAGENPAVSWTTYNSRVLRLVLCFKLATILDDDIVKAFWMMLLEKNEQKARSSVPGICNAVIGRVDGIVDARSREIVTDALSWCAAHPEALDFYQQGQEAKNGHMPNMVAFANLMQGIDDLARRWGRQLRKIVHDRQSQFEGTLRTWHGRFANASSEPMQIAGESYTLQLGNGSSFEVSASGNSPGIQMADVILWLHRKACEGQNLLPESRRLLDFVYKRAWHNDFSFDHVGQQVENLMRQLMSGELSPEQIEGGKRLQKQMEDYRQRNLAGYEIDGLKPYERAGGEVLDRHLKSAAIFAGKKPPKGP